MRDIKTEINERIKKKKEVENEQGKYRKQIKSEAKRGTEGGESLSGRSNDGWAGVCVFAHVCVTSPSARLSFLTERR